MMVRVVCPNGHPSMAHARRAALGLACPRCGVLVASRAMSQPLVSPGRATDGWLRTVVGGAVLVVLAVAATWGLTRGFSVEPRPVGAAVDGARPEDSDGSEAPRGASRSSWNTAPSPGASQRPEAAAAGRPPFSRFAAVELAQRFAQQIVDRHYDGGDNVVPTVREFLDDPVTGSRKVRVHLSFRGQLSRFSNPAPDYWASGWITVGVGGWSWKEEEISNDLYGYVKLLRPIGEAIVR